MNEPSDQIWKNDLLERKDEADAFIAYIESVSSRPGTLRADKNSFTIAVDAPYGVGKTWFLRRLSEQLGSTHPVAYVDAWADDLADEPLVALSATLRDALKPYVDDAEVQERYSRFIAKAGEVTKIVSWGLAKRFASFAIGSSAVESVSGVFNEMSDDTAEAIRDAVEEGFDDGAEALKNVDANQLMASRLKEFDDAKTAINELKASLAGIVSAITESGDVTPPIIIIIDELDRCRPTYAIKLLEEIKHLFDVPGLVFVIGMHGTQLSHSICGAYGTNFDGRSYLRRFIDREYHLREPHLGQLLLQLCAKSGIDESNFTWPNIVIPDERDVRLQLPALLAEYFRLYGLKARDAFAVIDMLQTAAALSQGHQLYVPYLLPILIGRLNGKTGTELPSPIADEAYAYWFRGPGNSSEYLQLGLHEIAERLNKEFEKTYNQLQSEIESGAADPITVLASRNYFPWDTPPIWSMKRFPELLNSVAQFKNPELATPKG